LTKTVNDNSPLQSTSFNTFRNLVSCILMKSHT
jgi:hypothetical protein